MAEPPPRAVRDLALALVWLTRLPLGGVLERNPPPLAAAVWAFPLVGLVVGALSAGVLALALWLGLPVAVAVVLAVLAQIRLTGGLHEDGLADYADGCGARDRARALEIMRDSRIGSYGVLALIGALALRATALAALAQVSLTAACLALVAAAVLSRTGMAAALAWMPPARRDGLGRGAGRVAPARLALALVIGLVLALACGALTAALAGAGAQLWLGLGARRRLGGQTGDVLGAIQQVGEVAVLVSLAVA